MDCELCQDPIEPDREGYHTSNADLRGPDDPPLYLCGACFRELYFAGQIEPEDWHYTPGRKGENANA